MRPAVATNLSDPPCYTPRVSFSAVFAVGLALFPPSPVVADASSLAAVAASSGRPRECSQPGATKVRNKKPSVWRRARVPQLVPYCDLLAKAHVLVESDPQAALALAEEADTAWPDHAGAAVAQGRALLALGKPKEALEKLLRAKELDKLSVEEPKAMRAHARALVLTGNVKEGAELYRTMVPRGSLLSERQRARLLLEAAFASMADAGRASKEAGARPLSESLVEASAFISEARSAEAAGLGADVLLAAALIHDRAGDAEKAAVALAEASRIAARPHEAASYVADPADAAAMEALAAEATSSDRGQQAWGVYLEQTKTEPFAAAARARVAALKGGVKPAKKKRGAG